MSTTIRARRAYHALDTFNDGLVKMEVLDEYGYKLVQGDLEIEIATNNFGWGNVQLDSAAIAVLEALRKYVVLLKEKHRS